MRPLSRGRGFRFLFGPGRSGVSGASPSGGKRRCEVAPHNVRLTAIETNSRPNATLTVSFFQFVDSCPTSNPSSVAAAHVAVLQSHDFRAQAVLAGQDKQFLSRARLPSHNHCVSVCTTVNVSALQHSTHCSSCPETPPPRVRQSSACSGRPLLCGKPHPDPCVRTML